MPSDATTADSGAPPDVDRLRADPAHFADRVLDVELFDYQAAFLREDSSRRAAVCGRQVGKTEMAAIGGLHRAATTPDETVLITAPTQRQSSELFKRVKDLVGQSPVDDWGIERETQTIIELANDSRIVALPAGTDGSTIRGYTAGHIIVDEAAFVDDQVFTSVLLPMLATTDGTLSLLSTPFGKRGFLYEAAWLNSDDEWATVQVPTSASPLVDDEWIADQRQTLSQTEFRQEIRGEFVEATDAFFDRDTIAAATDPDADFRPTEGVVLGADIARHGADRTVVLAMDGTGTVAADPLVSDADLDLTGGVGHVRRLFDRLDADAVWVDETGVGAGVVEMLEQDLPRRAVEGVKFTIDRKQSLYNELKSDLEGGDVTLPDHRRLRRELVDLEYDLTRGGKTRIHHPDGGHDDHPDALALAAAARREHLAGGAGDALAFQL